MDLRQIEADAGQTLVTGFDGVEQPPEAIREALRAGHLSGVILFGRNLAPGPRCPEVVAHLNAQLDACRPQDGTPIFLSVDQEGGRVQRIRDGVTRIPPMHKVGLCNNRELAAQVGEVIAEELAAMGFNLNFTPVLDLWTNPRNHVIGDRAFGAEVGVVAEMAGAITVGHYVAGVIPCGKHFPGHGDTVADSHDELPVVMHEPASLEERELLPFARAIQAGIPMIMTAHLLIPAIDALHPITLSPQGIERLLRQELEFDGVVVSDDLEMQAVADRYTIEEIVELGVLAGVDLFLIRRTEEKWRRAFAHLVARAQRDEWFRARLARAAERVRSLKRRLLPQARYTVPPDLLERLDTAAHRAIMARVERGG